MRTTTIASISLARRELVPTTTYLASWLEVAAEEEEGSWLPQQPAAET
jgi:hypothetical protein